MSENVGHEAGGRRRPRRRAARRCRSALGKGRRARKPSHGRFKSGACDHPCQNEVTCFNLGARLGRSLRSVRSRDLPLRRGRCGDWRRGPKSTTRAPQEANISRATGQTADESRSSHRPRRHALAVDHGRPTGGGAGRHPLSVVWQSPVSGACRAKSCRRARPSATSSARPDGAAHGWPSDRKGG